MLTIAAPFWEPNHHSKTFSRAYTEAWVERLYRGFARNLTRPFRFVCYTDREREFAEPIEQVRLSSKTPGYGDCLQPYELTDDGPMILVGLDTIICGNIDHLADYAASADMLALPRDPYRPQQACNGVALIPRGHAHVWTGWDGRCDDMERCRQVPHEFIDDIFPGQVVSYKGHVEKRGLGDTKVVYFHGLKKPHELSHLPWIEEHWR